MAHEIFWLTSPEAHDYPAAMDYLELVVSPADAQHLVELLQDAPVGTKKAKDILRASELPLLPADDPHVAKDLAKVRKGHELSPVLLIRANPLVVADGYHRICACYHLEPNTEIPCKLV